MKKITEWKQEQNKSSVFKYYLESFEDNAFQELHLLWFLVLIWYLKVQSFVNFVLYSIDKEVFDVKIFCKSRKALKYLQNQQFLQPTWKDSENVSE